MEILVIGEIILIEKEKLDKITKKIEKKVEKEVKRETNNEVLNTKVLNDGDDMWH